jgi:hypothetical protein
MGKNVRKASLVEEKANLVGLRASSWEGKASSEGEKTS